MPTDNQGTAHASLIIGCGFLGRLIGLQLLAQGVPVYATTRMPDRAVELASLGMKALILSVTESSSFAALQPLIRAGPLNVYYLIPPGRGAGEAAAEAVVRVGLENTVQALRFADVRGAALASSTAIYGSTCSDTVNADTPVNPTDTRSRRLMMAESIWLAGLTQARVVRLAGLYGSGRVIGAGLLGQGVPVAKDPDGFLNLIHAEDAASLLRMVVENEPMANVELGCDDQPVKRLTYYRWLADQLGYAAPVFQSTCRGTSKNTSKRCSNKVTCERTGWRPRFTTYLEGVPQALYKQNGGGD